MTTGMNRQTAKIIQFPIGARMSAVAKARISKLADELNSTPVLDYDSWYHEAAILEADESRKPQA